MLTELIRGHYRPSTDARLDQISK